MGKLLKNSNQENVRGSSLRALIQLFPSYADLGRHEAFLCVLRAAGLMCLCSALYFKKHDGVYVFLDCPGHSPIPEGGREG